MSRPLEQAAPLPKPRVIDDLFVALLTCFPVGVFLAILYNRFLPIQDAWSESYGKMMAQGKVPYRDFYYFTQPFSLLITRFIFAASDKLIYFRYVGCAERLVLTVSLYWLLRQQFSRFAAFIGTTVALIGLTSFDADGLFGYFYSAILFLVLAMGFLIKAIQATPENRSYLFLSGLFLGLSFFSKQSLGLMMGAAFFGIFLVISHNWKIFYARLMSFGAGFSLACLPFMIWIVCWNVSGSYYEDVFFNAGSQKGGLGTVFTAFFSRLLSPADLELFLALGFSAYFLYTNKLIFPKPQAENEPGKLSARYIYLTTILLLVSLFFASDLMDWYEAADDAMALIAPLVFFTLLVLAIFLVKNRRYLSKDRDFASQGTIIMLLGSLGIMYTTGMSYRVQEQALVPALGVCLGLLIDYTRLSRSFLMKPLIICFSFLFVLTAAIKKFDGAYVWYGWKESIYHQAVRSPMTKLDGFALDPNEQIIYQRICEIINQNCGPDDTVFTFPNCPMFNYLTDHPQPTFSLVHYWDVCPDKVADLDAASLQAAPPKVIVWLKAPWPDIDFQEQAFRNGHYSGYSHLSSVLREFTLSHDYQKMDVLQLSTHCYPVEVWVKTNPAAEKTSAAFRPSFPSN